MSVTVLISLLLIKLYKYINMQVCNQSNEGRFSRFGNLLHLFTVRGAPRSPSGGALWRSWGYL